MIRTSEYCTIGHPDRMADYISSYLLDRYLTADPATRFALEVQVKDDFVSLAGEVSSSARFDDSRLACFVAEAVREVGYTDAYADLWNADGRHVIDPRRLEVAVHVSRQSPDIAAGVDRGGWGDQGLFFGFATRETPSHMPKDHAVAVRLGECLFDYAKAHPDRFGIDIKTQVSVDDLGTVREVVVAIPCRAGRVDCARELDGLVRNMFYCDDPAVIVNGTGSFVTHSSVGDCGMTGRKLVVDLYGSGCRIGGGSPWTKDPSKADLALNLYARHLALVELDRHPLARRVNVALSCCIGERRVAGVVSPSGEPPSSFARDVSPDALARQFHLREPRYADACRFGLFVEFDELGC